MLVINYDPVEGWHAPEIKPYGPLLMDPMSSCFHYCPNVFEGMKVRHACQQWSPGEVHQIAGRHMLDPMEMHGSSVQKRIWRVSHVHVHALHYQ